MHLNCCWPGHATRFISPPPFLEEELRQEKEDLRLKIWARSVLRNPWASLDTDNPINVIAETVFFRLVKLIELCNVVLRLGIEILAYGALIVCAKLI